MMKTEENTNWTENIIKYIFKVGVGGCHCLWCHCFCYGCLLCHCLLCCCPHFHCLTIKWILPGLSQGWWKTAHKPLFSADALVRITRWAVDCWQSWSASCPSSPQQERLSHVGSNNLYGTTAPQLFSGSSFENNLYGTTVAEMDYYSKTAPFKFCRL